MELNVFTPVAEALGFSCNSKLWAGCDVKTFVLVTGIAAPTDAASSGLLKFLYSARTEPHVVQMYCPFSKRTRFSATISLGFSYSIFGLPSYSFSHVLQ